MATDNDAAEAATEQQQPVFQIVHVYLKDMSFENPAAPESLRNVEADPKVSMDIGTSTTTMEDNLKQVNLSVTIKLLKKETEEVLYLVEVQQSCIVQISGFSAEDLRRVLAITVPNILFPYIRETVDSVIIKAGFAPLRLAPINFDVLYQQAMEQEREKNLQTH